MTRNLPALAALCLLTVPLFAGCLELEDDPNATSSPTNGGGGGGAGGGGGGGGGSGGSGSAGMTAKETTSTTTTSCNRDERNLLPVAAYCARKTHWIDGSLTLASLPVTLKGFNGNVEVKGGTAGAWNLTAVLSARGDTEATATSNLGNIQFTWSHQSGSSHEVTAEAKKVNAGSNNQESAQITLILPASVLLTVTGITTNGDATARGVRTDDVSLTTSNGRAIAQDLQATRKVTLRTTNGEAIFKTVSADTLDAATSNAGITVQANAREAKLQSTNGMIDVQLSPTGVGNLSIGNTNGMVTVEVPEDSTRGYDVSASTSNGMVDISLEDGSTSGSDTSKTFKTSNYANRSIRLKTTIATSNAMVDVAPL